MRRGSIRVLSLLVVGLMVFGCHTFYLRNGKNYNSNFENERFHHIGILRLVEFSDPVNPEKMCGGKWDAVRTRTGPLQILVRLIVGGIYDPEEVSVACAKN